MREDHPNRGPHTECLVDHHGRGVPRHCRRGCKWPCPDASQQCQECGGVGYYVTEGPGEGGVVTMNCHVCGDGKIQQ